jgi:hypothetical protein
MCLTGLSVADVLAASAAGLAAGHGDYGHMAAPPAVPPLRRWPLDRSGCYPKFAITCWTTVMNAFWRPETAHPGKVRRGFAEEKAVRGLRCRRHRFERRDVFVLGYLVPEPFRVMIA